VKEKVFWVLRSANIGCSPHNSISAKAVVVPTAVFSAGIATKLGYRRYSSLYLAVHGWHIYETDNASNTQENIHCHLTPETIHG